MGFNYNNHDVQSDSSNPSNTFTSGLFMSFVDVLIQSLVDHSSDIKECIRYARGLWPKYIEPFEEDRIGETLQTLTEMKRCMTEEPGDTIPFFTPSNPKLEHVIVEYLARQIQPTVRNLIEQSQSLLVLDSAYIQELEKANVQSGTTLPAVDKATDVETKRIEFWTLRRYLLLAAYICQVKQSETDVDLITMQTEGNLEDNGHNEMHTDDKHRFNQDGAYRATSIRRRGFTVERLLSVYTSLVSQSLGKNTSVINHYTKQQDEDENENDKFLKSLVSDQLEESLIYFCDIGILIQGSGARLHQTGYSCSLSLDEACAIAKSVDFDLDGYLV
jgi:Origin recognition complex (ORC) subunit 5 C-terminus